MTSPRDRRAAAALSDSDVPDADRLSWLPFISVALTAGAVELLGATDERRMRAIRSRLWVLHGRAKQDWID